MRCYKDRTYCDTDNNGCTDTKCSRHLDTDDNYYSLKRNKQNIPVSMGDFSIACDNFKTKED